MWMCGARRQQQEQRRFDARATTPLPSDPSGDVGGGRWAAGGGYNLILQRSWEVVGDLDAAGGYEGGAVIVGFREIWAA